MAVPLRRIRTICVAACNGGGDLGLPASSPPICEKAGVDYSDEIARDRRM